MDSSPWPSVDRTNASTMTTPNVTPRPAPSTMASAAISNASVSSIRRSWPRVRPSARISADSLVRSITDRDSVLEMPSSAISTASPR